jgi:transcriptional regulator with XRE-family HTH domain
MSLTQIRTELHLSKAELSRRLGMNPNRVQLWEQGLNTPLLENQMKLARALGLSLQNLQTRCGWPLTPGLGV